MYSIGIYPNIKKTTVAPVLHAVMEYLQSRQIEVLLPGEAAELYGLSRFGISREVMKERINLALTLGGDGTLLNVAKETASAGIPVCGVNLGQLGFLTHIEVSHLKEGLARLIEQDYLVEERLMLDAFIVRQEKTIALASALNDVVVTKGGFARLIRLNLFVAGQYTETYPADGLIVATSTGSTGYSLSAGGPIISPNLKVMVVTPICPHTLNSRSLIISEEEDILIRLQDTHDDVALTVDGQKVYSLLPDDTILVRRSAYRALLVRFTDCGFYETLHGKLKRDD